jgi:hypothetical protein
MQFQAEGQWTYWPVILMIMGYNKTVFKQIQNWTSFLRPQLSFLRHTQQISLRNAYDNVFQITLSYSSHISPLIIVFSFKLASTVEETVTTIYRGAILSG